jgi:mono/diheme cytochrome c family protein
VRQLAFANPLLRFDQLLLVKRFTQQTYPDICLNHMPWVSRPGGDLCVLSKPFSPDGSGQSVRNLLNGALGPGHVHGMDLWWDADRVVFGYAKSKTGQPLFPWPPPHCQERYLAHKLRETEEPTHLFEIRTDGSGLRQLTNHRYWSDLDPTYLPNGDVAFASERCAYSLQCNHDPNLDETSCNLYVMRPDGSAIRRLSVNKDGDYLPHCLDDGTIGYTRWEYHERGLTQIQSLWTVRPDGTWADAIFKQHLNDPWAMEDVRSVPGTGNRKLVAIAAGHHTLAAGPVVVITPSVGMNDPRAIRIVTPGVQPPEGGMSGLPVAEGGVCDDGGYYMTPWALSEKYFLASYSCLKTQPPGYPDYCRGADEKGYALYLIDVFGNKELVYRDPEISSFVPIPLRPRPKPPILPDQTIPGQSYATCVVSDAGYGVAGVAAKQIRYLRVSECVPWPYDPKAGGLRYEPVALSMGVNWTPVRVVGTVPVEADGSAHFRVPVDTPVYFQLLDENQMELRRMRSFVSFQPGEVRACVGCHESRPAAPTDKSLPLALQREPSVPVLPPWGDRPLSFLRDVQPVFDRHCAGCHGGLQPAGGLDFSGGLVGNAQIQTSYGGKLGLDGHNMAYRTLLSGQLVAYSNKYDAAGVITQPLAFGSHKSKLVQALRDGPCSKRVKLSQEDWLRLTTWIDANAPYHDGFINMRPEKPSYDLPADSALLAKVGAVHGKRCASCHAPDKVTRPDWIDLGQPQNSRFLVAPLAKEAGGRGKCSQPVYKDQNDPDYQAVRQLVEAAVKRAWANPRRDLKALRSEIAGN